MMKTVMLFLLIVQFFAASAFASVFASPVGSGDRRRFFVIAGTGYASSNPRGALLEAGVEIRLFGDVHARLIFDHYFGSDYAKDNIIVKHIWGATFYGVYKIPLSETVDFRLKVGGHYASVRARVTALGLSFNTTMADVGVCAGPGFSVQLGNKVYLYAEAEVKYLMLDDPWTFVKVQTGIMYRVR